MTVNRDVYWCVRCHEVWEDPKAAVHEEHDLELIGFMEVNDSE